MNTYYIAIFILALGFIAFAVFYFVLKKHSKVSPLSSDEDQFIEVDSFKIRYNITGAGPKLVLIHGIGANLNTWNDLCLQLKNDFKILSFDLPGFGESSKLIDQSYDLDHQCRRIFMLLKKLDFLPSYLCGSSMGGAVALWLAKQHPNQFKKVVCLAPATHKKLLPFNPAKLLISSRLTSLALNEKTMRMILNRVVYNQNLIDPTYIYKYLRHFKSQPQAIRTFIAATSVISDPRLPHELKELKAPVLIYWGEHDRMVPFSFIKELHKILKNSTIIKDPLSGHHSMEDNPKGLSDHIKVFLLN